jgi:hypothetical protein
MVYEVFTMTLTYWHVFVFFTIIVLAGIISLAWIYYLERAYGNLSSKESLTKEKKEEYEDEF